MIRGLFEIFKCAPRPMLGRWTLKHRCVTEDIAVFNANRDHCGDKICGDQKEYKNMVPKKNVPKDYVR